MGTGLGIVCEVNDGKKEQELDIPEQGRDLIARERQAEHIEKP